MNTYRNRSMLLVTLFCCLSFSNIVTAQVNQTLNFSKAWFKPFLVENIDPVCDSLLVASQREFFSVPTNQYYSNSENTGPIPSDSQWTFLPEPYTQPVIIDGNKVYAGGFNIRGCGGACEAEYKAISKTPFLKLGSYGDGLSLNENQTTTSVPAYRHLSGLYRHKNGSYYLITKDEFTQAYKIKADATLHKVCVISNKPAQKFKHPVKEIYTSVALLTEKTKALLGKEGSCGSSSTLSRWEARIIENLNMTVYRPWAVYELPDTDSTYDADMKNLETWSLQDISQKQALDEYKRQLAITTKDLSDFFQKTYKWNKQQSDSMAYKVLTSAISSGIRFYQYNGHTEDQKKLLTAITENKPLSLIQKLAENPNAASDQVLNLTINRPDILDFFLSKLPTPNVQNEFNKSLLMYAAQYNQINSAQVLLKYKADPNLFTIIPSDDCNYTLSKYGMTALHYAVRYASYDFIKLLLDNGAYPYAKTSEAEGGYPIDWLKKYTADSAAERNPNISKEQALTLAALLELPAPGDITKKVLGYNLIAEQEFSKGNIESAYIHCRYALGLDPHNERALANLSLIALKMDKYLEALEASSTLFTYGKDINQISNAWFNYGLICETKKLHYERYDGEVYCENYPVSYFLESFKVKPTSARANKIVDNFRGGKIPSCQFSNGKINILNALSRYGSEDNLYILKPKDQNINISKISWHKEHQVIDENKIKKKIDVIKYPEKLVASYELGDSTLSIFKSDESIYLPIEFDGQICKSRSFGADTVSPSENK